VSCSPGATGDPLDDECRVYRAQLTDQSNWNEISLSALSYSSSEKREEWIRFSVWESECTTEAQAAALSGRGHPKAIIILQVQEIRGLLDGQVDVVWDEFDDIGPGYEGHSALTKKDKSRLTKAERLEVVDLVNRTGSFKVFLGS